MDTCLQCNTQNLNANCIWSSLLRYDAIQNTNAVENCPLLGHYAASTGNYLPILGQPIDPTFRGQFWPTDPWRWDRQVIPKRWQGITSARCVMTQKSAVLIYNAAEACQREHWCSSQWPVVCTTALSRTVLFVTQQLFASVSRHFSMAVMSNMTVVQKVTPCSLATVECPHRLAQPCNDFGYTRAECRHVLGGRKDHSMKLQPYSAIF